MATCNRKAFAKKLNATRKLEKRLPVDLRPLFKHLLVLARSNLKGTKGRMAGSRVALPVPVYLCRRAGRELYMARQLVEKHGSK